MLVNSTNDVSQPFDVIRTIELTDGLAGMAAK